MIPTPSESHRSHRREATRGGTLIALCLVFAALLCALAPAAGAAPTELFVSEYVEGSGSNKAVEIFNGTASPVTLTGAYDIQVFANGSPTATATIPLVGTVASGHVFVLARSAAAPALLALADQTTTNFLWNGNDAVALRHNGTAVDVLGQVGFDPGPEWGSGDTSTMDNTLRRLARVMAGDSNGSDPFDPSAQWQGLPIDTFDGLGSHLVSGGGDGGNRLPVAQPDAVSIAEDAAAATVLVMVNDSDADGDALRIVSATDGLDGGVTVLADGSALTYGPDLDFTGSDAFTYTIDDGRGGQATATVTVDVTPVNDDPDSEDDVGVTAEDTAASFSVLANDYDVDADRLLVAAVDGAAHGRASVAPDGSSVLYSPDPDFNGTDVVEVTVVDGHGGADLSDLVVTVTATNDAPVAGADLALVGASSSIAIDVLANDVPGPADESSQTLSIVAVEAPAHGTAEVVTAGADAGRIRYTPNASFAGSDSFEYTVSDGLLTATGIVNVATSAPSLSKLCALEPTIVGTLGDDLITGTTGDDVIRARRGNDVIDGKGGNDVVCGGSGDDRITTGDGNDAIVGGSGADTIEAGGGSDRVRGGFGRDLISTSMGHDRIAAGSGADSVDAGDGDDRVGGGDGDDTIGGGAGDDRIDGGPGTDACNPGTGKNSLRNCE